MAKSNSPQKTPKVANLDIKNVKNVIPQPNVIVTLTNQINQKLEHSSGFYFYTIRPIGGTLRAKFYIEKSTFTNILFKSEDESTHLIGIWLWLIRDSSEYKLIVSRAKATTSETKIPEPNWAFDILSNSGENLTENRIESSDFDWKNTKINEGLFGGIKGFFIGKGALTTFGLNTPTTDGLQIELWQQPDASPVLYFSKVFNSKTNIETFGSTSAVHILSDDGEGMAGSRPCPPYSN